VIGHATSSDLLHWEVQPPLSEPGSGFGHVEVVQVAVVDGTPVGLFSCLGSELSQDRRARTRSVESGPSPRTPCRGRSADDAYRITDERLYVGGSFRIVPAVAAARFPQRRRTGSGWARSPIRIRFTGSTAAWPSR
jgi:hypothetical protein